MRTCPKCGERTSMWSADLVSGVCKKCREAEAAAQQRQQEQVELASRQAEQEAIEQRRRAAREAALRDGAEAYGTQQEAARAFAQLEIPMRLKFKVFKSGVLDSWESVFQRAADFANTLPPSCVFNISVVAADSGKGLVTVWYWHKETMDYSA